MPEKLPSGTYLADDANLSGSVFQNANLSHVSIRNACLHDFSISDANFNPCFS